MYQVKQYGVRKNVPKNLRGKFATYDEARSAVRRYIRSVEKKRNLTRDWLDKLNRTVSIGFYNFSVERI